MPTRILRDGIIDSEAVNSLSDSAEILYRRLMSVVDDYGRYDGRPEILRAKLFALQLDRWPLSRVSQMLAECSEVRQTAASRREVPLILIYEVDGAKYLQVSNFGQRVRSTSKFPPPPAVICPQPAAECGHSHAKSESESYAESYAESESKASAETARPRIVPMPQPVDYGARYRALYNRHVVLGWMTEGEYEYGKLLTESQDEAKTADQIDAAHAEWMSHFNANPDAYRPGMAKWLKEGYWTRLPAAGPGRTPTKPVYFDIRTITG